MQRLIEHACQVVEAASGNRLGASQRHMVEARLRRRMAQLDLTEDQYHQYLMANMSTEVSVLISLLTTHHTFFFREFIHFEFIRDHLTELAKVADARPDKTIHIWSAACSRGQEVYSLAMMLETYLPKITPRVNYSILGSDIDPECVKYSSNGVYPYHEVTEVPRDFLGWWSRGTGDIAQFVRIKNELRAKCRFSVGNLDDSLTYPKNQLFDIVLCRNVLIYFNEDKVKEIATNLRKLVQPNGYLITGVSESLTGYLGQLKMTAAAQPSVYINSSSATKPLAPTPSIATTSTSKTAVVLPMETRPKVEIPRIIRVLAVDDSPTVLQILKQVLIPANGFQIIDTAENGIVAAQKVAALKPDAVTLDIHMPQMDGLTYLEKHFSKSHPPVVIISSASRTDSDVALKALRLGASDFVEKPSLNNIELRANEIRTKLKVALWNNSERATRPTFTEVESQFTKSLQITDTAKKARFILCNLSSYPSLVEFFNQLSWNEPPAFIFFEGHKEILGALAKKLSAETKFLVSEFEKSLPADIQKNSIYIGDFQTWFRACGAQLGDYQISTMVFGTCSENALNQIAEKGKTGQILFEDVGSALDARVKQFATDIVPATSFPYLTTSFLAGADNAIGEKKAS
jgi:chemotaxis protein methyltransferase CheR